MISLILVSILIYCLNIRINEIPPLGKFLNPYSGFWINGEVKSNDPLENIEFESLEDEIVIQYDSSLIPHIYAKNDKDLFLSLIHI